MAPTAKKVTEKDAITEAIGTVPEAAPENKSAATTGPRPRVAGKLAKPVYLIHKGKFTSTVPAVTREVVVNDPEDPEHGNVVDEVITEAYETKGTLPPESKFGSRRIGVAHEIWDAAEADRLRARGFEDASEAEIKHSEKMGNGSTDEMAARERVRAQKNLARFSGNMTGKRDQ